MSSGGKCALITGASRGIGRAAALLFAERGYDLVLCCGKRREELEKTAAEVRAMGRSCVTFTGDLGDPAECERLFLEGFGTSGDRGPDVLVNNAGVSYLGLLQDMTPEDWDRVIRSDLSAVFYLCRLAIPRMLRKGRGKIINLSSVWGSRGASCEAAYSAAKGGVNALTMALAKELAPSNIQVNAVAPGTIDTEMNQWLAPEERAALKEEIPAGRFGTPREAAEVICMLAEGPAYLTGQIVTVSGGWEI